MKYFYRLIINLFVVGCLFLAGTGIGYADDPGQAAGPSRPFLRSNTTKDESVIGSVETAGNRSIGDEQILSRVRSRAGELFNPDTAAADARRIAELTGVQYSYYNTAVVDGRLVLTFVVVEKGIIRSVVFEGNRNWSAKSLAKKVHFKKGDYLDPVLAEVGRRSLVEFYHGKGYAFAEVTLDSDGLCDGDLIYRITEGPRVKIKKVRFSGNKDIRASALRKIIKTKKKKFFIWSRYYDEQKAAADVTKLQNLYQKKGYLDAEVRLEPRFNDRKDAVEVVFVIDQRSIYTIADVVITGEEYFTRAELAEQIKSQPGEVYSEQRAESDSERLLKLYREQGFVDAAVEHRRNFVSRNRVSVEFTIKPGRRFRIGRIAISGNEQTADKVVRRVLDEYDFKPGQWYNADTARGDGTGQLEKTVRSTVMAESVSIAPAGEQAGQKDAQVNIVEGQTGMVMVGAGVASDSGVIGQFVFEQRNFDIGDWPESFGDFIAARAFKGAGQSLRIALQPGTEVSEYSISFTEPYLNDKPLSLDVVGTSYERMLECYDEGRTRGYVGFEKRLKDRWRKSIGFRAENIEVTGIDFDAPQKIKDDKGDNFLAGVRFGIGRDLTDDRFNPTNGYNFNVGYEQVAGEHTFGLLSATYRRYKTLHEDLAGQRTVLAAKVHAATTLADAPFFEKFYAGGQSSIRGFDYRGVSTRGLETGGGTERKDPIGSDWIFLAGVEATVPLVSESFSALFFVDSGAIDTGPYRAAIGTGIQILIPQWFGPVPMRFEFAAALMKDDEDDTQVFSFSVGRLF